MRVTAQGECGPAATEPGSGPAGAPATNFFSSDDNLPEHAARTRKLRSANISHPLHELSDAYGAELGALR
ncbi:hypothetical protein GCM10027068_07590 [Prescottella soli]